MSNNKDHSNLSLTGDKSQLLGLFQKIGSGIFVLGLLFLYFAYQKKGNELWALLSFGTQLLGAFLFTYQGNTLSFQNSGRKYFSPLKITAYLFAGLGLSVLLSSIFGWLPKGQSGFYLFWMMLPFTVSIGLFSYAQYADHPGGIKNNYVWNSTLSGRGLLGWIVGIGLTLFYIQLYWGTNPFPQFIALFEPLSQLFRGKPADKWFLYGTFYTFVILTLGIKFMVKYRHNRYQLIRTVVVIFSQVVFAYFIPHIMEALNYNAAEVMENGKAVYQGYYSANPINSWPLNYEFGQTYTLQAYANESYQPWGLAYLVWGIILFIVVTPVVTYFVGKRWYCSWFCGCGGLAETAGDSFRHLSNKSIQAWKIERWVIHSVMVFVLLMTLAVLVPFFSGNEYTIGFFTVSPTAFLIFGSIGLLGLMTTIYFWSKKNDHKNKFLIAGLIILLLIFIFFVYAYFAGTKNVFLLQTSSLKKTYGFFVGSAFSGVIGVGFYPILGNRVWCRFGCPMAGYMGIIQRFKSRFRITTNGGQCISCGNCSTYCEQGIDVRAYAQKGQNIVRASCVGCGICSAVCPRGVLKLENGPEEDRILNNPILIGKEGISLIEFDAK